MTSNDTEDTELAQEAYEQTDFEVVEHGDLQLPTSKPARFETDRQITPDELQEHFEDGSYAFIAPFVDGGHLSSKLLDAETNEFLHLKLWSGTVGVYPKGDEFSLETLERAVDNLSDLADLELIGDE